MSDAPEWPREIWMREREEHDQGIVSAVLSEHATIARWEGDKGRDAEFHRYVDADIHDSAERYHKHQTEALRAELEAERAENARLREALLNSRVVETMLIADHLRDKAKRAEEMPAGFTIECVQPSDVAAILRSAADAIDLHARASLRNERNAG